MKREGRSKIERSECDNLKAVILAGGKGTRMGDISREIPKPMVRIGEKPLLEHQIELLKRYGITDITLITGHLSSIIRDYFGDGTDLGVRISYFVEKTPLGTTGGIKEIEDELNEDFLVVYGDVMINFDLSHLLAFHAKKKGIATLVLHPNDHPQDSDLVELDNENRVIAFLSKPHREGSYYHNMVNAAHYVLSPDILEFIAKGSKADFGKDIFPALIHNGNVFGHVTAEYLKDVGTPERLQEVMNDYRSGKIRRIHREFRRKAIFLDRDGVVNRKVDLLHRIEDFELHPFTGEAIRKINRSEYLAILITNQPVIARGLCTLQELDEIHKKMETLLGREGAKLDAIYFCPHHPDKGFPEENPEFKVVCSCRKPATGMIDQAISDFNIDREGSFFIGDSFRDIECGRNAGISTIGVRTGDGCRRRTIQPDHMVDNLRDAVELIFRMDGP